MLTNLGLFQQHKLFTPIEKLLMYFAIPTKIKVGKSKIIPKDT